MIECRFCTFFFYNIHVMYIGNLPGTYTAFWIRREGVWNLQRGYYWNLGFTLFCCILIYGRGQGPYNRAGHTNKISQTWFNGSIDKHDLIAPLCQAPTSSPPLRPICLYSAWDCFLDVTPNMTSRLIPFSLHVFLQRARLLTDTYWSGEIWGL